MSGEEMHRQFCSMPEVPERTLPAGLDPIRAHLIRLIGKNWVNGTVLRYCFLSQPREWAGTEDQKQVVRSGFNVWKNEGIGVKFEEVTDSNDAEVRIGFSRGEGSWSYVGREILDRGPDERTMNFGWDLIREDPRGVDTTTHEIGHTLGFPHEHQNPNSGIKWNEDAVYDWAARTQGWDKQKTWWNIIRKIEPYEVEGSKWDPDSIMHYPFDAGMILEPEQYKNGLTPAGGLSERDKTWVKTFYPPLNIEDRTQLTLNTPTPIKLNPGEPKEFGFVPPETRVYDIQTSGESDTVMALFEEKNGQRTQLAAADDSGTDLNAHIQQEMTKGNKYVVSIRLYYDWAGDTTVKVW